MSLGKKKDWHGRRAKLFWKTGSGCDAGDAGDGNGDGNGDDKDDDDDDDKRKKKNMMMR
jgi:hypothetical protein